ncbi:8-oxo-dGTP diphosphatase [Caloranaerobacter azorensis DSM 13643]|uniref:8-oxo-dGTP diphosphatase n=1 Tax=Caloranaerobacter azorensis DSM 13643 TaxID=1121264 RepID=A0A1M5R1R4_9FIRM|nr:NUDIX domain-containing protein [Caloranaerobacter azorensis]SHH20367.1 8-oxo-dGTP diphosphatase [Caloranaerobacter azorensis DSM 13643]
MLEVKFYDCNEIEENKLIFVVIMAKFNDKWVLVRHKERNTWEIPAGHIEPSESVEAAASRELFEETGAIDFTIYPVNIYSVNNGEQETYGQLFYAEIRELGELPQTEIAEIKLVDELPKDLTYPLIQPILAKRVQKYVEENF